MGMSYGIELLEVRDPIYVTQLSKRGTEDLSLLEELIITAQENLTSG